MHKSKFTQAMRQIISLYFKRQTALHISLPLVLPVNQNLKMKIAVLSDIHGNFPALIAVADHIQMWKPDRVFVAGDIVNRGPCSNDCFEFIEEKQQSYGWQVIRGNHEDYVIDQADRKNPGNERGFDLYKPVQFTVKQLNNNIPKLISLPENIREFTPFDHEVRVVHASMRHNRDGIYHETSDAELSLQIAPAPKVFITGHTHRPLIRSLDGTVVINAGSCGLPFDGDQRTGYVQITWQKGRWQAEFIRLKYDFIQAKKDFSVSGYLENAGPLSLVNLFELESATSQLYHWSRRYAKAVLAGATTVSEAVEEFLKAPMRQYYS
jgi:putative phosphoesterase